MNKFPLYYIQHFNKFTDIILVEPTKLILYCPFFYTVVDLSLPMPKDIPEDTKDNKEAKPW